MRALLGRFFFFCSATPFTGGLSLILRELQSLAGSLLTVDVSASSNSHELSGPKIRFVPFIWLLETNVVDRIYLSLSLFSFFLSYFVSNIFTLITLMLAYSPKMHNVVYTHDFSRNYIVSVRSIDRSLIKLCFLFMVFFLFSFLFFTSK